MQQGETSVEYTVTVGILYIRIDVLLLSLVSDGKMKYGFYIYMRQGYSLAWEMVLFGLRPEHWTEATLVALMDDLSLSIDRKQPSIFILLDLSSMFYTLDLKILLFHLSVNRVQGKMAVSLLEGCQWLIDAESYAPVVGPCICLVLQRSIVSPLLFNAYLPVRWHAFLADSSDHPCCNGSTSWLTWPRRAYLDESNEDYLLKEKNIDNTGVTDERKDFWWVDIRCSTRGGR